MAFSVEDTINRKSNILAREKASRRSARHQSPRSEGRQVGIEKNSIDNYEAASNFLEHFHAFASQSLGVIDEDNGDDAVTFSTTSRVFLRKTKTLSSLSTLANQPTFPTLESRVEVSGGHYTNCFVDDTYQDWGFDFEDAQYEDQEVSGKFKKSFDGQL